MCWLKCSINWLEINASWLVVVATFFAIVVALCKDSFWSWVKRPKLRIEFNFEPPDCQLTYGFIREKGTGSIAKIGMFYIRFRVTNIGRTAAKNVEVCASKLSRIDGPPKANVVKRFMPMYLKWSNTSTITMNAIPIKMFKTCDLMRIIDPGKRELGINEDDKKRFDPQKAIGSFEVEPKPNSCDHLIEAGKYVVELLIGADNCKPIKAEFIIEFDGVWIESDIDMIRGKHIIVEKV